MKTASFTDDLLPLVQGETFVPKSFTAPQRVSTLKRVRHKSHGPSCQRGRGRYFMAMSISNWIDAPMQRIPGRALRALFAPLLRRLRQRPHEPLASYDAPRTLGQTKRATDEMNRRLATVAKRTTNAVVTTDA